MKYPETTVQSQYAASPVIRKIVDGINAQLDPSADIKLFFDMIFNVATAQGVGLDIWGRIVGVDRKIYVDELDWFGFYGQLLQPFNHGVFYNGNTNTGIYEIADDAYRTLILWKAMANIATGDAKTINTIMSFLFAGRGIYFIETDDVMSVRLVVETALTPFERAALKKYGFIGLGAGVGLEILEVPVPVLGFAGSGLAPFGEAPFFNGSLIDHF